MKQGYCFPEKSMGILPPTSAEVGFHPKHVLTCFPMHNLMPAFERVRSFGSMPGRAALLPGTTLAGYATKHMQNCSVTCPTSDSFIASWRQASPIMFFKNYPN